MQSPKRLGRLDLVEPLALPGSPLREQVFTDFAFFTRDKPWLKGLLCLELLTIVSRREHQYAL